MSRVVSQEQSGLVLTRQGTWLYQGSPVENPRISAYFHRCIQKDEEGKYFLKNQGGDMDECVYFQKEGTAYFIENLYFDEMEEAFRVLLNTGIQTSLDLRTLYADMDGSLYARILDRDAALFTSAALQNLASFLEEDEQGYFVRATGQRLDHANFGTL